MVSPSAEADGADDVVHAAQAALAVIVGDLAARLVEPGVDLQVGWHRRGGRDSRGRQQQHRCRESSRHDELVSVAK